MQHSTDADDHITLVYVMGVSADGPVKIGHTRRIIARAEDLQIGNPLPVRIFGVRFLADRASDAYKFNSMRACFKRGAVILEKAAHKKLDEFGLRLRGEWFDVSAADALAVIEKVSIQNGLRCVGLRDLAAADMKGRADREMKRAHSILLHEAAAVATLVAAHNDLAKS